MAPNEAMQSGNVASPLPQSSAITFEMQRATAIRDKLVTAFAPSHLAVLNESDQHKGPPGRESHFRVVVVSDAFAGKQLLVRHKLVYAALGDELRQGLHALAMVTKTSAEWELAPEPGVSPLCATAPKPKIV